ncbi:MAG TPA: hypothetical protein VGD80_37940 [Kofleriaceae bacterium]
MTSGNPEELTQLIDRVRQTQERSATEAASALSAVESWLAIAEQRQGAPRASAAPSAPDPGDREPGAPGSQPPIR